MNRRSAIKHTLTAAAGLAATATIAGPSIAQSAPKITWRMTSSFPKTLDTIFGAAMTMANYVREATDGNFDIQVFAAGEIVPPLGAAEATATGTVEACHTASYYYWSKDPTWALATAVPFMFNSRQMNAWLAYGGGEDLVNEFFATKGLYGLACGNTGAQMGGWYRKEIKSIDDLKGVKMRVGGFPGAVMSRLGLLPQQMPPSEIYSALDKGTIDAAEWIGPYDDERLGLHKVAKYYYYPGWWEGGPTLHALFNQAKWQELPKSYRSIVRAACNAANADMLASYDAKNPPALRRLIAGGTQLRQFSNEILNACFEAANATCAELSAKNPSFKKIFDNQVAFRKDAYLWTPIADYTFDSFMIQQQQGGKL